MNRLRMFKEKKIKLDDLATIISPGNRIFLSSGPSTPMEVVNHFLTSNSMSFKDLEFVQLATFAETFKSTARKSYRLKTFSIGENIGKAFVEGNIDFIPTSTAEIPYLFVSGAMGIDVAIVSTSVPDDKGFVNLGIVNDISRTAIEKAKIVVAEVNRQMPVTNGSTSIHLDEFDYFVESEQPLIEVRVEPYDEIYDKIGWHIADLIEDGSTLSMGVGKIFNAIAANLRNKRELKVWSHVVSDWVMDLIEHGVVESKGLFHRGFPVVATSCVGSKELYKFVHENPYIELQPLLQSSYQSSIQRIKKLVSILNVSKIDISGDAVVPPRHEFQISGFDSKLNFSHAATFSRDGKAVVALRSVDKAGNSNIVITHSDKEGRIRSTLGSTHYVVTEYGYANVFGKSIRERAIAIINIAHPDHREKLIKEAKEAGFVYKDQIYCVKNVIKYPYDLETVHVFTDNLRVAFRPIKPTDEEMMRRLFYGSSQESKYMRYSTSIRTMPHTRMQPYVNIDYEKTLSIVGVIHQRGIERIISESRYAYYEEENTHEMAFVVDEEFQGRGISSFMLDYLLSIAEQRKIGQLSAYVLKENEKMTSVLKKARIRPEIIDIEDQEHYRYVPAAKS
jgi:acyl-CoA hydrolase/RimJ/RimL family protein N-acetyltransferase